MATDKIEKIEEELNLKFIPAVIFDKTYATLTNKKYGFVLYINPIDQLRYINYKYRESLLCLGDYNESIDLDTCNFLPPVVLCSASEHWKER